MLTSAPACSNVCNVCRCAPLAAFMMAVRPSCTDTRWSSIVARVWGGGGKGRAQHTTQTGELTLSVASTLAWAANSATTAAVAPCSAAVMSAVSPQDCMHTHTVNDTLRDAHSRRTKRNTTKQTTDRIPVLRRGRVFLQNVCDGVHVGVSAGGLQGLEGGELCRRHGRCRCSQQWHGTCDRAVSPALTLTLHTHKHPTQSHCSQTQRRFTAVSG